jgi:hypothetical protein
MESEFELLVNQVRKVLYSSGVEGIEGALMNQYQLILEAPLVGSTDRIRFDVSSTGDEFITEIRLLRQDVFACTEWGLFLLNTDGRPDVRFEEHLYPDPEFFGTAFAPDLGIIYHSSLSFIVNNFIVQPGIRTDVFKKYVGVRHRREMDDSGLRRVPNQLLIMQGTKQVGFRLDLPRKINFEDSGFRVRLRLGGFLLRNVTGL